MAGTTIRVYCKKCHKVKEIDTKECYQHQSWPECCEQSMVVREKKKDDQIHKSSTER